MKQKFETRRAAEVVGLTAICEESGRFGLNVKDSETGEVHRFVVGMESAAFFMGALADELVGYRDRCQRVMSSGNPNLDVSPQDAVKV